VTAAPAYSCNLSTAGRIAYRRRGDGALWGEEHWTIRHAPDGGRTLTVHCTMRLGDDDVVRDTTLSVDAGFQPVDAYVRIANHGRMTGTGWFRFGETHAECESWTAAEGRISQRMPVTRPMRGFGIHALMGDGWMTATFPADAPTGTTHFWGTNLLHSIHHLGATGPMIATSTSGLTFAGIEQVTVKAGRFACRAYDFAGMTNGHPPYRMWISDDEDRLYVRGEVGGYMDSLFELETLDGGE
jgi:hypothetical protein